MADNVLLELDRRGIATLTLNRPEVHNAFDAALVQRLTELLVAVKERGAARAVVLTGAGRSFSAGADLNWMRAMAACTEEENFEDALQLADLMALLNSMPLPTVARVNGHAYGGGVGLLACCDLVLASNEARFALSEVRLGLVPAVISPYVIAAIGERNARRLFLSGEAMNAKLARRVGLVHEIAKPNRLDAALEDQLGMLLRGGPVALRESKQLIATVTGHQLSADDALKRRTAEIIAQLRGSAEGQEGLAAFLEKREPAWIGQPAGGDAGGEA
ncbi:enoyl-CoA hydratase-related protein [Thioalkalivibrio sp. XN8]|uniref:enoyl-CoA hydratase-related protein n=1 Tax=Thioalkalivibrio sp. XN8 TaxID=2712863 RepID=UPI0013ECF0DA|nr:enoyl-CoA hydratase-related protein [Thioalkalivibrio sp. XN8]NGP53939.1 enoyl-CoA hydratase/isomerase family protein [Thioalkalivibrio sp. XN8]